MLGGTARCGGEPGINEGVNLTEFVAAKKRLVYDDLQKGNPPSEGRYSEEAFKDAKVKGKPQMGKARFKPNLITLEFIYSDPNSSASVFTVELDAPERIIYMPVPKWVVESVWQGEVAGSYHFATDAQRLLAEFSGLLEEDANQDIFAGPDRKTRESPFG